MSDKKSRFVAREELSKLLVTDADAFTQLRFLRRRDETPTLVEIEEYGEAKYPKTVGCLADLYHGLWAPEPQVREEDKVTADRRWWQKLMDQTLKTSAFQELHAMTELSEIKSVLGTVTMGETILANVSEEDGKKLRDVAEAQAEADALADKAAQAQAQADALGTAMQEAEASAANSASGQGQPGGNGSFQPQMGQNSGQQLSSGPRMSAAEAKSLADKLAEEQSKAQERANAASTAAKSAQTKADQLSEELLGQPGSEAAEQKMRELARIGQAALKKANAKVVEVSDTIEAWGLGEGELAQQPIPESLALLERMRRTAAFKQFAALLGRIRKIAAKKAKNKEKGEGVRESRLETGRDIHRATSRELVAIASGGPLATKALIRWSRGELEIRGEKTKRELGHGPIVVCEDASGSMDGAKQQWAKAATLSLAHYAKLRHRGFGWIMFDCSVRKANTYPAGKLAAKELLEIAEARSGGGTNFEKPLSRAIKMIREEGLKKADILFITDGECEVSKKFLEEFLTAKKALEFHVVTILCDVGSTSDASVRSFSDKVEKVSAFTAEEAETKIFKNL